MVLRKAILFITVLVPGLLVVATSLYWFNLDYAALGKAEDNVEKLIKKENISDRDLQYAYHRAELHRINVFADGTWGLIGGVITAIGIYGVVFPKE